MINLTSSFFNNTLVVSELVNPYHGSSSSSISVFHSQVLVVLLCLIRG